MLDMISRSVEVAASSTGRAAERFNRRGPSGPLAGGPGGPARRSLRGAGRRVAALLLTALALPGCGTLGHRLRQLTGGPEERLAGDVVIERDAWGVPHVHGRSATAAAFGLAYAMAEDGYWEIEQSCLEGLGWLSHYYGEMYLAHDRARAALDVERRARAAFANEPPEARQIWTAFTRGLNYYLRTHPRAPRRLVARYEPWMLFTDPLRTGAANVDHSFAWAIAPARSATGRAWLVSGLDAPYFGPGRLYEAELRSDDGWHVRGAAVHGRPVFLAGQNVSAAWALAASPDSAATRILLFDHPSDSLAYRDAGEWHRAELRIDSIRVNTATGVVRRGFPSVQTHHGPVVERRGDTAWVATAAPPAAGWHRFHALSRTLSLDALRALLQAGGLPGWNLVYADSSGAIALAGADGRLRENPPEGWLQAGERTSAATARLLASDAVLDSAALERVVFDAWVPSASLDIARLIDEWERIGGTNPRRAIALDTAIEALRGWDHHFNAASTVATLYATWQEELATAAYRQGDYASFRALEAVVPRLQRQAARAWGEVQRLQRRRPGEPQWLDSVSRPLGAAPSWTDALFTVQAEGTTNGTRQVTGGRAWSAVIELTGPPRGRTVSALGVRPDAPAGEQDEAEWFAAGRLKDAWFGGTREGRVRQWYHPGDRARVLRQ